MVYCYYLIQSDILSKLYVSFYFPNKTFAFWKEVIWIHTDVGGGVCFEKLLNKNDFKTQKRGPPSNILSQPQIPPQKNLPKTSKRTPLFVDFQLVCIYELEALQHHQKIIAPYNLSEITPIDFWKKKNIIIQSKCDHFGTQWNWSH